jgi:hypothetical protein
MDKFSVNALDPAGNQITELKVSKKAGAYVINIGAQYKTLWYIITRE